MVVVCLGRQRPGTHFGQCRGPAGQPRRKGKNVLRLLLLNGGEGVVSLRYTDLLGRVDTIHESGCRGAPTGQDFQRPFARLAGSFSDR